MKFKFTVELEFDEKDQIDTAVLTEQIDGAVSDRVDGWYSVEVEYVAPGDKFVAPADNVEVVRIALQNCNPNATDDPDFQENWDDEAIQELANYLATSGYIESDLRDMDELYFLYDMLKWTRANNV